MCETDIDRENEIEPYLVIWTEVLITFLVSSDAGDYSQPVEILNYSIRFFSSILRITMTKYAKTCYTASICQCSRSEIATFHYFTNPLVFSKHQWIGRVHKQRVLDHRVQSGTTGLASAYRQSGHLLVLRSTKARASLDE